MTEPTITLPRLLLASHVNDINHELTKLMAIADELASIDMGHFSDGFFEPVKGILASLTALAEYMQQEGQA